MSVHVLLNLLNKSGKRDKMRGLPIILSLFHSGFNEFNDTGARMSHSFFHITVKLLKNRIFDVKTSRFSHLKPMLEWA